MTTERRSFFGFGPSSSTPSTAIDSSSPTPPPASSASNDVPSESFKSMIAAVPTDKISSRIHPSIADDGIEYLFIDDNPLAVKKKERAVGHFGPLPMRTGYDKLNYGTGVAYLCGITMGGLYGAIRGLQNAPGNSYKIRMNSLLNTATRYGPWAANSLGVLTIGWALTDNLFSSVRGVSDYYNHISAAFLTGVIFKSTAGLRPAMLAGGLMAGAVSLYGLQERFANQVPSITLPERAKMA